MLESEGTIHGYFSMFDGMKDCRHICSTINCIDVNTPDSQTSVHEGMTHFYCKSSSDLKGNGNY